MAVALAVALGAAGTSPVYGAGEAIVVEPEQVAGEIGIEDAREREGTVTATVVSRSSRTLRDVRIRVAFDWYWKDEKRPGTDDPTFAPERVLPGEIPPGARVPITYEFPERETGRTDGEYHVEVRVIGFTAVTTTTTTGP